MSKSTYFLYDVEFRDDDNFKMIIKTASILKERKLKIIFIITIN